MKEGKGGTQGIGGIGKKGVDGGALTESGCSPKPLGRFRCPLPRLHPSVRLPRILLHPVRGAWKLSQAMRDRGELGFISLAYVCQCVPARD